MKSYWTLPAAAALAMSGLIMSAAACHGDFLTGGELSVDPNRPSTAANSQLFVGVQSNLFYTEVGDLTRISDIFAQQFYGTNQQYQNYDQYNIDENTTNGQQRQLYGSGGLKDVRALQTGAIALKDSLLLGIAQVQEAMLMGFGADAFGDMVYTKALGADNPPLDHQLVVYDSLEALLSRAITNMSATGATNVGPGSADLVYAGNPAKWIALAHTLKARFYMHTAEARPGTAYASALTEAQAGITSSANDYHGVYSGNPGEQNPWWNFISGPAARAGYLSPSTRFDSMLVARSDPRRTNYYTINSSNVATGLSATRNKATYPQPIATYIETQLIIAEAAARAGTTATAQTALINARTAAGFAAGVANYGGVPPTGAALLAEILAEEYIADFQLGLEAWRLYRRTCFPNLPSRSPTSAPMPGRYFYDQNERLTNTNIPTPGTAPNGIRSESDPANTTSDVATLGACQAGA